MRSAKVLIGAAALAALAARRARMARPPGEAAEEHEDAEENVHDLREQLRSELARLASADIKASRSRRERMSPPG
jgi:hypothetical protein